MRLSRIRRVAVMAALGVASATYVGVSAAGASHVAAPTSSRVAATPEAALAPAAGCSTDGLHGKVSCAKAVQRAQSAAGRAYTRRQPVGYCDRVMAWTYGWPSSGSGSAAEHWRQLPARYRHKGDRTVPAGGLAFFAGGKKGYGHVMISIGGGRFMSTDIHGPRTLTRTTIAEIEKRWHQKYLGWSQPWFKYNH